MEHLLDLMATLERSAAPALLMTLLHGDGSGCPPPGLRRLLSPGVPPPALERAVPELLATGTARTLTLPLGPDLDRLWGRPMGRDGAAELLLERLVPGKLPPWLHFCSQVGRRGGHCVLVTVAGVAGDLAYALADRFVYDERNHGLLPMDGRCSLELQRASERARAAGMPIRERLELPGGALQVDLEPL